MKALYLACAVALALGLAVSAPLVLAAPAQTAASTPATAASARFNNFAREQRIMADWSRLTALPDTAPAGNTANAENATTDPAPHATQADPPTTANIAREQRTMADWTRLTSLPDQFTSHPEIVTTSDTASR